MPIAKRAAESAFWDASGIVLLAVEQRGSARARALRRAYGRLVVWWGSRVEVTSALSRLAREVALDADRVVAAERRLASVWSETFEVAPTEGVRARAQALLRVHPLRAGDALQLAAALALAGDRPKGRVFVCFDARLAAIASSVGFDVPR